MEYFYHHFPNIFFDAAKIVVITPQPLYQALLRSHGLGWEILRFYPEIDDDSEDMDVDSDSDSDATDMDGDVKRYYHC